MTQTTNSTIDKLYSQVSELNNTLIEVAKLSRKHADDAEATRIAIALRKLADAMCELVIATDVL